MVAVPYMVVFVLEVVMLVCLHPCRTGSNNRIALSIASRIIESLVSSLLYTFIFFIVYWQCTCRLLQEALPNPKSIERAWREEWMEVEHATELGTWQEVKKRCIEGRHILTAFFCRVCRTGSWENKKQSPLSLARWTKPIFSTVRIQLITRDEYQTLLLKEVIRKTVSRAMPESCRRRETASTTRPARVPDKFCLKKKQHEAKSICRLWVCGRAALPPCAHPLLLALAIHRFFFIFVFWSFVPARKRERDRCHGPAWSNSRELRRQPKGRKPEEPKFQRCSKVLTTRRRVAQMPPLPWQKESNHRLKVWGSTSSRDFLKAAMKSCLVVSATWKKLRPGR